VPRCDCQNPAHPNIDAVLESPSLFFTSQSKSSAVDFVEMGESLKELRVRFGVTEVVAEESS